MREDQVFAGKYVVAEGGSAMMTMAVRPNEKRRKEIQS